MPASPHTFEPRVLFEDNHLLVVDKPAGMLSQGDHSGDLSLLEWGKVYIKENYNKPGKVFLGLVHRLDRPSSGVMVFARTSKAASRLSEAFRARKMEKVYRVLVVGQPDPTTAKLDQWLVPAKDRGRSTIVNSAQAGAQQAVLTYRTLRSEAGISDVEVELQTGRKHQIRAQFAKLGCPVLGDHRYGAQKNYFPGSIALHAAALLIPHPTLKEQMTFESAPAWAKSFPEVE